MGIRKYIVQIGIVAITALIVQFPALAPSPAQAAQGCALNSFYGTVTYNGVATDNVAVTLTDLTNGAPALSAMTSSGGLYLIETANLATCAVAGDQIKVSAAFNAYSTSSTVTYAAQAQTQVNLAIVTPSALTAPVITSGTPSQTSAVLAWSASTGGTPPYTYNVKRNGTSVGNTTSLTFTDTGLTAATAYSYTITATDSGAPTPQTITSSPFSVTTLNAADTTAPSVPANVHTVAVTTTQVDLAWNASTDNVGVTGYKIYRDNVYIATVATNAYSDTGLTAGTTYSYQVTAIDAAGNESARSTALSVTTQTAADTTAPSVPMNVHTVSVTANRVDIAWNASTDNVGVTGYKVYRDNVFMMTVATNAYYNTGLSPNTTYTYEVTAIDAAGNESARSTPLSVTTSSAADTIAPSVPTNLHTVSVTDTRIDLAWNASTDNVGVTGYKVYRGNMFMMTVSTNAYYNSGLAPNTTYSYQISAIDQAGNESAKTAALSVTTAPSASSTPTREQVQQKYTDAIKAATQGYDTAVQTARTAYNQAFSAAQANLQAALAAANNATSPDAKRAAIQAAYQTYRDAVAAAQSALRSATAVAVQNMQTARQAALAEFKAGIAAVVRAQKASIMRRRVDDLNIRRNDAVSRYESQTGYTYTGEPVATSTLDRAEIQQAFNDDIKRINQTYQDANRMAHDAYTQSASDARMKMQTDMDDARMASSSEAKRIAMSAASQAYRDSISAAQAAMRTDVSSAAGTMRSDRQAAVDKFKAALAEWNRQKMESTLRQRVYAFDKMVSDAQKNLDDFLASS